MFYVYILESKKDKKHYIGQTNNIDNRIKEHNNGKVSSTRGRRPLGLIYFEQYKTRKEALRKEKYYKTQRGRQYLKDNVY